MGRIYSFVIFAMILHVCVSQLNLECLQMELPKCLKIGGNVAGVDIESMGDMGKLSTKTTYCKFANGFRGCVKDITPAGKCDADQGFSQMVQIVDDGFKAQGCGCGSLGASIALVIASVWFLIGKRN